MTAARSNVELSVNDVAEARGCHRNTARAWLKELEAEHGTKVVYRRQGRLYTTKSALSEFAPTTRVKASKRPSLRLATEVVSHGQRLDETERRLDALYREFLEFRRQAREWFMGRPGTIAMPRKPA